MFDLGWTEMMLIGIVALIVVGPKELPGLFRTVGQWVGRARGMAREFSRAMEAAADETGMKEIDRTIRAAARPLQATSQFAKGRAADVMGLGAPKAAIPPTGTPLPAGAPGAAVPSPGPATEALAAERREAAARRADDAVRRAEEALSRARQTADKAREAAVPAPAPVVPDAPA